MAAISKSAIPGIDSFRFFCFLMVFVTHTLKVSGGGYAGVYFFFVISSFLLTFLALNEIKRTGQFSRKNFFVRRALRIYPLYFLVVFGSFLLLPFVADQFSFSLTLPAEKWKYLVFLSNFEKSDHVYFLQYFWSVSIEEQFYVAFIFLSFFFKKNFYTVIIFLFALYFGFVFLYGDKVTADRFIRVYTLNAFSCFTVGMLLAKLYFENKFRLFHLLIVFLLLALFLWMGEKYIPGMGNLNTLQYAVYAAIIIINILMLRNLMSTTKSLAFRVVEYLGKMTYGLYVYSGIVITVVTIVLKVQKPIAVFSISFLILVPVAYLSYRFFELPFLKLKDRWRS